MGRFDETLRREQERNARERDAGEGGGLGDGSDEGGNIRVADASRSGDLRSENESGQGQAGSAENGKSGTGGQGAPGEAGSTSGGGGGSGAAAREIPDGSDDDIIARRLRRAAEQETDPELKDKLWTEYTEYKKSVQGR